VRLPEFRPSVAKIRVFRAVLLVEHAKVLEAAVVGRVDDDDLVKPEAFVVLTDGDASSDALAEELLQHCK